MQPKHGPGCTRRDHEPHVNLMSPTRKIQHLRSANLRQHTHRVTLLPERRTSGSGQLEPRDAITRRDPGHPEPSDAMLTRRAKAPRPVRDHTTTATGPTADLGTALCATAVAAAIVGGAMAAGARQPI